MKRRAFLAFLVIPLLAGCGGGGGGGNSDDGPAVFRTAFPLATQVTPVTPDLRLTVRFRNLKASSRGDITVFLERPSEPPIVVTAATVGPQTLINDDDQYTVVTFNAPSPGTYFLRAVDSETNNITKDETGSRIQVTITD